MNKSLSYDHKKLIYQIIDLFIKKLILMPNNKDLLTDPITLEKFTYPIITRCGHTFDRDNLEIHLNKHSTCPICKTTIVGDINSFPINWVVANQLNLDIKKKKMDPIVKKTIFDGQEMARMVEEKKKEKQNKKQRHYDYVEENINSIVDAILDMIKDKISRGNTDLPYRIYFSETVSLCKGRGIWIDRTDLYHFRNHIKKILNANEFSVDIASFSEIFYIEPAPPSDSNQKCIIS